MQRLVKIKKNETILDLKNFKKEPDEIKFRIITNILTKELDHIIHQDHIKLSIL